MVFKKLKIIQQVLGIITLCFLFAACNSKRSQEQVANFSLETEVWIEKLEEVNKPAEDSIPTVLNKLLRQFNEFDNYQVFINADHDYFKGNLFVKGDFYGDQAEDIAILLENSKETNIGIINYGNDTTITFLGNRESGLEINDFSWVGIFKSIESGDTLWSNYQDDFREMEDVPQDEKIVLAYDAIYVHASESCGGGFIFWKDEQWNWLQQE